WLYFPWLYRHSTLWTWLNILLPAFAVIISLTGLVWGVSQLLPLRVNGQWRWSVYRGVSKWHHLAGIVFGLFVLTWTFSGVLEMFGSDHDVRAGQAARIRGGPIAWPAVLLREPRAMLIARSAFGSAWDAAPAAPTPLLRCITFAQISGRPG